MAKSGDDLDLFLREALTQRIPRDRIRAALAEAGWRSEQVEDALRGYADVDFPLPVPRPRTTVSAKEAFLYLVLFTTLYISAYSLGELLFEIINTLVPDPAANVNRWSDDDGHWALARIIIAFPVYAFLTYRLHRDVSATPSKRASPVRRWLTYIALFIAVITMVCDLVVLVFNFLDGALTLPLLLKVAVVAVIAGGILAYYGRELRLDESEFRAGAL